MLKHLNVVGQAADTEEKGPPPWKQEAAQARVLHIFLPSALAAAARWIGVMCDDSPKRAKGQRCPSSPWQRQF
jgi:hypothetical protein